MQIMQCFHRKLLNIHTEKPVASLKFKIKHSDLHSIIFGIGEKKGKSTTITKKPQSPPAYDKSVQYFAFKVRVQISHASLSFQEKQSQSSRSIQTVWDKEQDEPWGPHPALHPQVMASPPILSELPQPYMADQQQPQQEHTGLNQLAWVCPVLINTNPMSGSLLQVQINCEENGNNN